jgi:hypothetical protein
MLNGVTGFLLIINKFLLFPQSNMLIMRRKSL